MRLGALAEPAGRWRLGFLIRPAPSNPILANEWMVRPKGDFRVAQPPATIRPSQLFVNSGDPALVEVAPPTAPAALAMLSEETIMNFSRITTRRTDRRDRS